MNDSEQKKAGLRGLREKTPEPTRPTGKSYYLLRWVIIAVLGFMVYRQTFQFDFVYDDQFFIVQNPHIRNLFGLDGMWDILPRTRTVGIYSFALNYHFNRLNPHGYHVVNFLIHLAAVALVWGVTSLLVRARSLLFKDQKPERVLPRELPFFVALLFLVHPCQTQAVTYITQRFEAIATVFYLASMYAFLQGQLCDAAARKARWFILAGVMVMLGVLTKETVITAPVMMIAAAVIIFPGKWGRGAWTLIAAVTVVLGALFIELVRVDLGIFTRPVDSQSHEGDLIFPFNYLLTQLRVFLTFARLLVFPVGQNLEYDFPMSTGILAPPTTLLGGMLIAAFIGAIVRLRRGFPLIAFGLAWMLVTFSINLAPRPNVIYEHKLYLISYGFFLALAVGASAVINDRRRLGLLAACLVVILSVMSFKRNLVWENEITLWSDVIKKSPRKAKPYCSRGLSYFERGDLGRALADYNRAIELSPFYAEAYNNRGLLYERQGLPGRAILDYHKAFALKPYYAQAYNNRGVFYARLGRFDLAVSDLDKALALKPDYAEASANRGFAYFNQNKTAQALEDYQRAIDADPQFARAYYNRAVAYFQLKQYAKGLQDVLRAKDLGMDIRPELFKEFQDASDKSRQE